MTSTDPTSVPEGPALTSAELISCPYEGFNRIREQAPLVRGEYLDGSAIWYVTRDEDVRALLADPRFVNSTAELPGGDVANARKRIIQAMGVTEELAGYVTGTILDSDGDNHARLRKLVSRAFTVRRVAELRPSVERIAEELLDELTGTDDPSAPVDLVSRYFYPLPITVICDLVGIPKPDRPLWRRWSGELTSGRPERFAPALRELVDYTHRLVDDRRLAHQDDLLSALIRAHDGDGDRLSATELVTMILTLVLAGHETTAHLLGNAVVALLTHPEQLAAVQRDPDRWPDAVHEVMRWCSPVQITGLRYAGEDMHWGGVDLHIGDEMQAVLVAANRDPRAHDDPERLDVTRQRPHGHGEAHVGFGHGVHYCLGAALARQEGEIALRALFARYPDLTLAVEPDQIAWQPVPGSRRLTELPVRL
jgi:hypothetical protein